MAENLNECYFCSNSPRGTALCFTSTTGEIDDGEYATLRSATSASVVGIAVGGAIGCDNSAKGHTPTGGVSVLRLSEYEELPPPPPPQHMISSMTILSQTSAVNINSQRDYVNCPNGGSSGNMGDDNISEEGKLLACVRDDSVTYASTRDLEPPLPPPPPTAKPSIVRNSTTVAGRAPQAIPDIMQLSSSPEHLVSPLAPVTVTLHSNEAHVSSTIAVIKLILTDFFLRLADYVKFHASMFTSSRFRCSSGGTDTT